MRRILALTAMALLSATSGAQVVVDVEPPEEVLEVPLPQGRNRIVKVSVTGEARSVWLALGREAEKRVLLSPVAKGTYAFNLSDPKVEELLLSIAADRRDNPTFVVCAEDARGELANSVPLSYKIVRRGAGPPELHLVPVKGTTAVIPLSGVLRSRWVTVSELQRLALATGEAPIQVLPRATTELHSWTFAPESRRVQVLPIDKGLREAWLREGSLHVVYEPGTDSERTLRLDARPEELRLESDPSEFTIVQRKSAWVPGSRHFLRLAIGDISAGRVLVELTNVEGDVLLAQQAMKAGEELRFTVGDTEYVLFLGQLVNYLIGDDYGVFTVGTRSPETDRRITAVLEEVARSERKFVRNGRDYTGAEAAEFLRQKYRMRRDEVRSFEDFLERIADRSSTTGMPYHVRVEDGKDIHLARWLAERDAALEKERAEQKGAVKRQ